MNATNTSAQVYSTSTIGGAELGEHISSELVEQLNLQGLDDFGWMEEQEFCFVCSRPTDHRGEHDDLVEQGRASYDTSRPVVYNDLQQR